MKQIQTVGLDHIREVYGVQGVHQVEAISDIVRKQVETCITGSLDLARKASGPMPATTVVYEVALPIFVKEALTGYLIAALMDILHMKTPPADAPEQLMDALHTAMDCAMSDALSVLLSRVASEQLGDG